MARAIFNGISFSKDEGKDYYSVECNSGSLVYKISEWWNKIYDDVENNKSDEKIKTKIFNMSAGHFQRFNQWGSVFSLVEENAKKGAKILSESYVDSFFYCLASLIPVSSIATKASYTDDDDEYNMTPSLFREDAIDISQFFDISAGVDADSKRYYIIKQDTILYKLLKNWFNGYAVNIKVNNIDKGTHNFIDLLSTGLFENHAICVSYEDDFRKSTQDDRLIKFIIDVLDGNILVSGNTEILSSAIEGTIVETIPITGQNIDSIPQVFADRIILALQRKFGDTVEFSNGDLNIDGVNIVYAKNSETEKYANLLKQAIDVYKSKVKEYTEEKTLENHADDIKKLKESIIGVGNKNNKPTNFKIASGDGAVNYIKERFGVSNDTVVDISKGKDLDKYKDGETYSRTLSIKGEDPSELEKIKGHLEEIRDIKSTALIEDIYDKDFDEQGIINIFYSSKDNASILAKLVLFHVFNIEKKGDTSLREESIVKNGKYHVGYTLTTSFKLSYNAAKSRSELRFQMIKGDTKKNIKELYTDLYSRICKVLDDFLTNAQNELEANNAKANIDSAFTNENNAIENSSVVKEDEFFYITNGGRKMIPTNVFVDVQFKVPIYDEKTKAVTRTEWVSVSDNNGVEWNKGLSDKDLEKELYVHSDTYFDSLELIDKASGAKTITLTLKSPWDINLENIIINSLSLERKIRKYSGTNDVENITDMLLKNTNSNFRVRFGYRDGVDDPDSVIRNDDNSSIPFMNRTQKTSGTGESTGTVKPVLEYPWVEFKITGLSTSIIGDESHTYTIQGVNSGTSVIEDMSLKGVDINFSDSVVGTNLSHFGRPLNVLGTLSQWLYQASNKTICVIGSGENSIITGTDAYNEELDEGDNFVIDGGTKIKSGVALIPREFISSKGNSSNIESAHNFVFANDKESPSIKQVLDELMKWLPPLIYVIGKNNEVVYAQLIDYSEIMKVGGEFFTKYQYKTELPKYQIIEANAKLNGETKPKKRYLIRIYYEGPGLQYNWAEGKIESNTFLRKYSYMSGPSGVVTNLELSSGENGEFSLGNVMSSVTVLHNGAPYVFTYNEESQKIDKAIIATNTLTEQDMINGASRVEPYLASNRFTVMTSTSSDGTDEASKYLQNHVEASRFFTAMKNQQYKGSVTILGDPFYFFDSKMEPASYDIMLDVGRVVNAINNEHSDSYFSGMYKVLDITHSISSSGEFRTTLGLAKRIFTSDSSSSNKE